MAEIACKDRIWDIGYNYTVEVKIAGGTYNKINWLKFEEKLNPKIESFFESEKEGFSTNVRTGTDIELDFNCLFDVSSKAIDEIDSIKYNIANEAVFDIKITNTRTNKIIEDSCILTAWSAPNEPSVAKMVDFSIKYCGKPKGLKILKEISDLNTVNDEIAEATAQETSPENVATNIEPTQEPESEENLV